MHATTGSNGTSVLCEGGHQDTHNKKWNEMIRPGAQATWSAIRAAGATAMRSGPDVVSSLAPFSLSSAHAGA
jgi:hypothetical protein